jgi:radical SAM superfamily enzyme YgiQ (UPF0313 family)
LKILLISPSAEDDIVNRAVTQLPYMDSKAFFAPHALTAVAAITPPEHQVRLHDEHMHSAVDDILLEESFDIVGISLISNQLKRTLDIAEFFRKNNIQGRLVIGGIGTTNVMPRLKELVDVIFLGEAEMTWPLFLKDYANGSFRESYQQISKPDMRNVPIPRWEFIEDDIPHYGAVSVQTTRGCNFDCSFCDVIYTYGRKIRSKEAGQVLDEISLVTALGAKMVMIADDNFTANRTYAKKVLRRLIPFNNSLSLPLAFMTQVDITIARDDELLELLADANFIELQIGVESPDKKALEHMNKLQNLRMDISDAIRKIQSYGIAVQSHLIIGSDADDCSTFQRIINFVKETNITHHCCHPLMAPPGTKLWYELKRAGRLVEPDDQLQDMLDITSNIFPKNMSRIEMMEGMADYWDSVIEPSHYLERALGFLNSITWQSRVKKPAFPELWKNKKIFFSAIWFYAARVSKEYRKGFFKLLGKVLFKGYHAIQKAIFLYTRYMMDITRDNHSSRLARERAAWEKDHPVKPMSRDVPVPAVVRSHYREIFTEAYGCVQPCMEDKELLYRIIIHAMIDYIDRFREDFKEFDDYQKEHVRQCCNRILKQYKIEPAAEAQSGRPPAGFEREILDALDHVKRFYKHGVLPV